MNIIADTSPLISLAILDRLDLLDELFVDVYLPQAVFDELAVQNKPYAQALIAFTRNKVMIVKNQALVETLHRQVDLGESEAIALALEMNVSNILIDDAKGRKVVREQGLHPIGTIGVLLQAKQRGVIEAIKPALDTLMAHQIE